MTRNHAVAGAACLALSSCCLCAQSAAAVNTAVVPVSKLEQDSYDWYERHEAVLAIQRRLNPQVVLIGDSITHFWAGEPRSQSRRGPEAWQDTFGDLSVLNLGFGVMGVLPRGHRADDPWRASIGELNRLLAERLATVAGVRFLDIGTQMLAADGALPLETMPDGTHPSEKGYAIWGRALVATGIRD